jgi:predicted dehydrogenase
MTLRVGIMGAGMMGVAHAQAYRAAGVQIAGVTDADGGRAADLAERFGGEVYPSLEALAAAGLDAVSVCLPHNLHLAAARLAAQHRAHVLMEKPLANTLAEAQQIVDACEGAGVKLMVGFIQRFLTGVQQLRAQIADGAFGRIGLAVEHLAAGGPWPVVPPWYRQRSAAGGGIMMIGNSHTTDRLRWLLDSEAETVYGAIQQIGPEGDVEDVASAVIRYRSGVQATVIGVRSPLATHRRRWTLDLYGERAEASFALQNTNEQALEITTAAGVQAQAVPPENPFLAEIREFVTAIEAGREPAPNGRDGMMALATVLAIYESARTGLPVNVPDYLRAPESAPPLRSTQP